MTDEARKMDTIKQVEFAALNTKLTPPRISVWTISGSAALVRERVSREWPGGWEGARNDGIKIVKVEISFRLDPSRPVGSVKE